MALDPNAPFSRAETRVVLMEGVSASATALFQGAGYTDVQRYPKALEGDALVAAVRGAHILGIRSRTQLTAPVLASAGPLMAVGCFCIGTDQVNLAAAAGMGIPVFNAPFSNTRSVAELVIGEIVMLLRRITPRSADATAHLACTLFLIQKSDLEELMFLHKDLAYELLWTFVRTLSGRLRETNDKIKAFFALSARF